MTINGVTLDFNLYDAEVMEKYEKAFNSLGDIIKNEKNIKTESKRIRSQCEAVRDCFDTLFGPGAGVMVCGEPMDLMRHLEAFNDLVVEAINQKNLVQARANEILKSYGYK